MQCEGCELSAEKGYGMQLREIRMTVGDTPIGTAITWPYPDGNEKEYYKIPTYRLLVEGTTNAGRPVKERFEVLRFGVSIKGRRSKPRVVGLTNLYRRKIMWWEPRYTVHSYDSKDRNKELGAWKIWRNFLIHDGPDDPRTQVYATAGCIEICNGPSGFDKFNDCLIALSGATAKTRARKLEEISKAKSLSIKFMRAPKPALKRWP
jgi:hypothetical protein